MHRRRLLATTVVTVAGLTGCMGYRGRGEAAGDRPATATSRGSNSVASQGIPETICSEEIHEGAIRAIDDPAFASDWDGVDVGAPYANGGPSPSDGDGGRNLSDEDLVIGVERGGSARAYPIRVLWQHEAVNDTLDGPLLVTYCPLCRSGQVAVRRAGGVETTFGVSGLLWRPPTVEAVASADSGNVFAVDDPDDPDAMGLINTGNVVLFDERSGSYWSQLLARAICGPLTGERLEILPSTLAKWGDWRREHPDGTVLLPPPHSTLL